MTIIDKQWNIIKDTMKVAVRIDRKNNEHIRFEEDGKTFEWFYDKDAGRILLKEVFKVLEDLKAMKRRIWTNEKVPLTEQAEMMFQLDNFMREHLDSEWRFERWLTYGIPDGCDTSEMVGDYMDEDGKAFLEWFEEAETLLTEEKKW